MITKQIPRNVKYAKIFSALNDRDLEKVAALVVEKEYEAGTVIFREGDNAEEFFLLQEGKVALQMISPREDGRLNRRVTVEIIGSDDVFGWSALVEPYIYTLTAVCLQKVVALSFSSDKIKWMIQDNHEIGYGVLSGLIKVVASRLHETRRLLISERLLQ